MKEQEEAGNERLIFDAGAISVLQGIFSEPTVEKNVSRTASVKFMITLQDEEKLRELGYSQIQINKLTPQEAETIIRVGTKAERPTAV
jgi:hypothetical protein